MHAEADRGARLDAAAIYQDFFTFEPGRRFDAISCMGVIEDLSDYPRVMPRFAELLKPGARAYLDFAAGKVPFGTSSFVTKYVWPGTFRMVYMPELMEAIDQSPMQLVGSTTTATTTTSGRATATRAGSRTASTSSSSQAKRSTASSTCSSSGTAGVMNNPAQDVTAYRMVLELAP